MKNGVQNPVVSVLLPFVDEGEWLIESINSITRQSFEELELLLINNGSDRLSMEIATRSAAADARIRIIHENKKGIAHALNTGIGLATGRYIARMDADDIAEKDRISECVSMLEAHARLGVAAVSTEIFPITDHNQGFVRFVAWQNNLLTAGQHALARFIDVPVAHPAVVMRASLFTNLGLYSTEALPEDYELWLRWMQQGVRFAKSPKKLLRWRDHGKRLTRSSAHYAESAFAEVRMRYLSAWIQKHIGTSRPIMVCGSSPNIRSKIAALEKHGIIVDAVTDVKEHSGNSRAFISISKLKEHPEAFIVNLIARTDLRDPIHDFLCSLDRKEGIDFIMAG